MFKISFKVDKKNKEYFCFHEFLLFDLPEYPHKRDAKESEKDQKTSLRLNLVFFIT